MDLSILPTVNASLNALCTCLLISGFIFIRKKAIQAHRVCMGSACLTSVVFLVSYITYHSIHGTTYFEGQGIIRIVYFTILISHTILAATVLPLVIITLVHALRSNIEKHKKIARFAFPVWLYVSVTGVLVYLMLYHLPATA